MAGIGARPELPVGRVTGASKQAKLEVSAWCSCPVTDSCPWGLFERPKRAGETDRLEEPLPKARGLRRVAGVEAVAVPAERQAPHTLGLDDLALLSRVLGLVLPCVLVVAEQPDAVTGSDDVGPPVARWYRGCVPPRSRVAGPGRPAL